MRWERAASVQTSPDEMQGRGALLVYNLGVGSITCSTFWVILHNNEMDSSYGVRKCPVAKKQMEKGSFTVQVDS